MVVVDAGYLSFEGDRVSLMAADSDAELHDMAGRIGLRRAIFSAGRSHFYSVSSKAREKLLTLGAILVDRKVVLSKLRSN